MDKAKRLKMKLNKDKLKKQLQKSQELKATIQQKSSTSGKKEKSKINKTLIKKIVAEENNKKTNTDSKDDKLTPLQQKFKKKLAGAQFRWINEQLYTLDSKSAYKLINDKPELFSIVIFSILKIII